MGVLFFQPKIPACTNVLFQQISLERSESKSGLIDMKENSLYPIGDMSMPTYFGKVFIAHLVKAYNTRFSGNNYIPMENIFCRFFLWMLPCRESWYLKRVIIP